MNTPKLTIVALAIGLSASAQAQDLSTKVEVERTIQPTERTATRLEGIQPTVVLPKTPTVGLSTAKYDKTSELSRSLTHLNPAEGAALPEAMGKRGYASLGFLPDYNLGASAGYRIVNARSTTLDFWGQFYSEDYKPYTDYGAMKYNSLRFGVDVSTTAIKNSQLDIALKFETAKSESYARIGQEYQDGDFRAKWCSKTAEIDYKLKLDLGFDSYNDIIDDFGFVAYNGLKEFRGGLGGDASIAFGDDSRIGLDVDAKYGNSLGLLELTPYYALHRDKLNTRVGIELDMCKGLSVMPDIELAWTPSSQFAVKASATGGSTLNTMNDIRRISSYLPGIWAYSRSRVPIDAELSFVVGRFAGFGAEIFGGYSVAKDWLMPDGASHYDVLCPTDIKGWHGGLRMSYTNRNMEIGASVETASNEGNKGYYLWRDRAKYVVGAYAHFRPIENLSVGVNYEFRSERHTIEQDLGCASNLGLNARYDISDNISVFVDAKNVLGRRYQELPGIGSQKLHGLIGMNFKF